MKKSPHLTSSNYVLKGLFTLICWLMSCLLLTTQLQAQCTLNTCTTPTIPVFTTSTTISGTTSWTGACVQIDDGVTITITGNLSILGSSVRIGKDAEIIVNAGAFLTIAASDLYAFGDMWLGIDVREEGTLTITESRIADAYEAVEAHTAGPTFPTNITIGNNTCLLNNEIGVYLEANDPADFNEQITDTEIQAPSLKAPLSAEPGDYGILLVGNATVYAAADFFIGNTLPITGSTTFNYIHDVAIGIRVFFTNATIQNTRIAETLTTTFLPGTTPIAELADYLSGNVGILANSANTSPNLERNLIVGTAVLPAGNFNNDISNISTAEFLGIVAESQVNTTIQSNTISGGVSGSTYLMDEGIRLRHPQSDHLISNNVIREPGNFGIRVQGIANGTTQITSNQFIRAAFPSTLGDVPIGISVNDISLMSHFVTISNNLIDKVETGIFIQNQTNATISGNNITFSRGGSGIGYGIRANNDADLLIQDNYISSNCSTCALNRMCVHITDCSGVLLDGNYFNFSTVGAMIYASAINGNMYCNEFHDCRVGVGLEDIDVNILNDFGVLEGSTYYINHGTGIAADNGWYPTTTANRERHFGTTDVINLNWRYRDVLSDLITPAPQYDIPAALTVPSLGSFDQFTAVLTNDTFPECGYLFRMGDITSLEEALEYMEQTYANAGMLIDVPVTASEYYRRWQFWREQSAWEGLSDLFSTDIAAFQETIAASNIPVFQNVSDSIAAGNYIYATEILSVITPLLSVEEYLQNAYAIYLNRVDENGHYELTDEDREQLLLMAQSDPNEYGMGVHVAAAILDTILHRSYEIEEDGDFDVERMAKGLIHIYPNPATDVLYIWFDIEKDYSLSLIDLNGHEMVQQTGNRQQYVLFNLKDISPGIYILSITTDDGRQIEQIVVL